MKIKGNNSMKVLKFGGTSVANAQQIRKIAQIITVQKGPMAVVVSAPGKRSSDDTKVTDALITYAQTFEEDHFKFVKERFIELSINLQSSIDIVSYLDEIKTKIQNHASYDYILSRGEYLNALLIADYLEATFIDAKDLITINRDGSVAEATYSTTAAALADVDLAIIPGFYGQTPDKRIQTFSRGGSDITGSIIAKAVNAEIYQNWTDVSGIYQADPRIAENAKPIKEITYDEMLSLATYGAGVFHPDAIAPAKDAEIIINVRNTDAPNDAGTLIIPTRNTAVSPIAAVAAKSGFGLLIVKKAIEESKDSIAEKIMYLLEHQDVIIHRQFEDTRQLRLLVSYKSTDFLSDLESYDGYFYGDLAQLGIVGAGLPTRLRQVMQAVTSVNARLLDITYTGPCLDVLVDQKHCDDVLNQLVHGDRNIFY